MHTKNPTTMANTAKRTAQSSTKRVNQALNLIAEQGVMLTCSDYNLDYFDVVREFESKNPGIRFRKGGAKAVQEYVKGRILEQADKGTPTYWINRAYRDIREARQFALENSRFIRTMERSTRGFAAVDADQVTRVAATSVCY